MKILKKVHPTLIALLLIVGIVAIQTPYKSTYAINIEKINTNKIWVIPITNPKTQTIKVLNFDGNTVNVKITLSNKAETINPPKGGWDKEEIYKIIMCTKNGKKTDTKTIKSFQVISEVATPTTSVVPTIASVDDLNVTINQKDNYNLPKIVNANMSDGSIKEFNVSWSDNNIDTSKPGTFEISGVVRGYDKRVNLTLLINPIVIEPSNLTLLEADSIDNGIRVFFSLFDEDEVTPVKSDGTAKVELINSNKESVCLKTFDVKKADFKDWYRGTDTSKTFNACSLDISLADIKKSVSSGGKVTLDFKTANNTVFHQVSIDVNNLPVYTDSELKAIKEQELAKIEPSYIGGYSCTLDKGSLNILFSLYDKDDITFMQKDGSAKIDITNSNNESVYSKTLSIKKEDFQTTISYGVETSSYLISIPLTDIKKANTEDGTISLEFTTANGTAFKALTSNLYDLPKYTDEELKAIAEQAYQANAIALNTEKNIPNYISVTVNKIGLMTLDGEQYIRVDISVKNIGNDAITYYSPDPVILGKSSNQYDDEYVSKYEFDTPFETGSIYPGVIRNGAIFFKTKGNPQLDVKELIIKTGLTSYYQKEKNLGFGNALIYNNDIVLKYDLSNLTLKK